MSNTDPRPPSNGNGGLYFIVGALVVVVAVIGYLSFADGLPGTDRTSVDLDVTVPESENESSEGGAGQDDANASSGEAAPSDAQL